MRKYNIYFNKITDEVKAVYDELTEPGGDFAYVDTIAHDLSNQSSQMLRNKVIAVMAKARPALDFGPHSHVTFHDVEPYGTERTEASVKDEVAETIETVEEPEVEGEKEPEKEESEVIKADKVAVAVPETNLMVGQSFMITATVTPDNATDKEVVYESSDKAIATVSQAGEVKAVAKGQSTIRTALKSNLDVFADTVVTVDEVPAA